MTSHVGDLPQPRVTRHCSRAFTLLEMLIAIAIFSLVLTAIYSTWTAILRSAKSGQQAAATVQRSRIVVRVLEDSLGSALCFFQNQRYYGFVAENGSEAMLSFVARLSPDFPRSGNFGDFDVRRVVFSVEPGPGSSRQLVLRQVPLMMDLNSDSDNRIIVDEKNHPVVLAKNVKEFKFLFWDQRRNDWVDEWKQTNQLPKGIVVTLKLADTARLTSAQQEITRIISLPATGVQALWQMPRAFPGMPGPGGIQPPGTTPPGTAPPSATPPGVMPPGTVPGVIQPSPVPLNPRGR
ncbi:MAG: prepilin-type N-terminal cleavage/methylation domain-containing protein [Verrucomicrobiota bacterium]